MDVSRYTDTTELKFEIEFITPTFLGGADGNAEVRTAPFKNLIRRWWRIANGKLSPDELWKKEAELFGSTEKNPDIVTANKHSKSSEKQPEIFGKSKIEIKILERKCSIVNNKIDIGSFETEYGSMPISTYLGYGAIGKKYIETKSIIELQLLCPLEYKNELINTIFLIHLFGTIGSRSHNGWGSLYITPRNFKFAPDVVFNNFLDWENIVISKKDYPHLIGKDKKGVLCWKTDVCRSWSEAFSEIGTVYHDLVNEIKMKCYDLNCRKLLGFATGKERMPSHFLIKVVKTKVKIGDNVVIRYYGQILHIPYIVNMDNWSSKQQLDASSFIHQYLDKKLYGWQRNPTGGTSK